MYEKLEQCPSCKGSKLDNHTILKDHSISGESFAIMQCKACELLFTNPRPDQQEIWKYYDSDNYISHSNKSNSLRDVLYKLVRNYTLGQKVKLVESYHNSPTVLDYGCGTGHFLQALHKAKHQAIGIEPTRKTVIPEDSPIYTHTYEDLIDLPKGHTYDIITAWHVLEHVHSLTEVFKNLVRLLAPKGTMIVALPNHLSFDAGYYKDYWAAYDVPRHLYHFNPNTFKDFAARYKLRLMEQLPMMFDAYYVSMLSEQYKKSKNPLIAGLKRGQQSNKQAKKSGQYSSMIYILSK